MAKVSNLKVQLQAGTSNTVFASWEFTDPEANSSSGGSGGSGGSVSVGSWVKVKSGSVWYNGAAISSFVYNYKWKVIEINGSRAVINDSDTGGFRIMSPINVGYLQVA